MCNRPVASWTYRYTRDVALELANFFASVKPVAYTEVLRLNKKLQDFRSHPSAFVSAPTAAADSDFYDVSLYRTDGVPSLYPLSTVLMKVHGLFTVSSIASLVSVSGVLL